MSNDGLDSRSTAFATVIIRILIIGSIGLLLGSSFADSQANAGSTTQILSGRAVGNVQPSIGSPVPGIGTLQPGIGSQQPGIGAPLASMGMLQRSIGTRHSTVRGVIPGLPFMFSGTLPRMIILPSGFTLRGDRPADVSEPEPPPLRSAPPVFFIQQCGQYVRIPAPEAGRLDTVEQEGKC